MNVHQITRPSKSQMIERYQVVIRDYSHEVRRLREQRKWTFAEGVAIGAVAVLVLSWL